jgi:hypothetical protein
VAAVVEGVLFLPMVVVGFERKQAYSGQLPQLQLMPLAQALVLMTEVLLLSLLLSAMDQAVMDAKTLLLKKEDP